MHNNLHTNTHTHTHTQAIRVDIPQQPKIYRMHKAAPMPLSLKKRRLLFTAGVQRLPASLCHAHSALQGELEAGNQCVLQHDFSSDSRVTEQHVSAEDDGDSGGQYNMCVCVSV